MKKYELLEKAMRDYPAGTVARFKSAPNVQHISDGVFKLLDLNNDGNIGVFSGHGLNCFYISNDEDGRIVREWAYPELDTKSLLSGKCAIQVNNEREFKLLMEHYEAKGWKSYLSNGNAGDYKFNKHYCNYDYHDNYRRGNDEATVNDGYTIIPFSSFAAEVGIKVPEFVMTSEDGVDLNQGDIAHHVCKINGRYTYNSTFKATGSVIHGHVFSTKESAEAFVAERNSAKFKEVKLFGGFNLAKVTLTDIHILHNGKVVKIMPSDLEDMLKAYKSLKQ